MLHLSSLFHPSIKKWPHHMKRCVSRNWAIWSYYSDPCAASPSKRRLGVLSFTTRGREQKHVSCNFAICLQSSRVEFRTFQRSASLFRNTRCEYLTVLSFGSK